MHCNHFQPKPISRREMLLQCANGFGAVAFASLFSSDASADPKSKIQNPKSLLPHYQAKAKSVIFLFMDGGPSQVDTFDPNERLIKEHGQPIKMAKIPATQFDNVGNVLKSPW